MSDLQSNIVCVERIKEYTEIDSEVIIYLILVKEDIYGTITSTCKLM